MIPDITQLDQVTPLITEAINAPISPNEEGAAIAGFATTYIELMNAINVQYRDSLEQAIAGMKQVNSAEIDAGEKFRLGAVKRSLGI